MTNVARLQAALAEGNIPALFLTNITNVQWLTGFSGSSGVALVTPTEGFFITDSRYTLSAQDEVKDLPVRTFATPKTLHEFVKETAAGLGVTEVVFETSLSVQSWKKWTESIPEWKWVEGADVIRPLRMTKTEGEIAKIRAACQLADACLHHVQRLLQPGVTEMDISLDIEFFFRRQGANCSFEPIVASGPNGAKPHARPGERALEAGDLVTLDLGCLLDGYCSDITRTFAISTVDDRQREVYNQVLLAQIESCKKLVAGTAAKDVDLFSREILAQKQLDGYFGHSLGHGLGREVHDFGSLSSRSEDMIAVGQVWTVEPGVYIDDWGGLRIEDDVLVTESGPEILTHFPKELIIT